MGGTGRNDPCPCGSGKKYKKCCLPKDERSGSKHEPLAEALDLSVAPDKKELARSIELLAAFASDETLSNTDRLTARINWAQALQRLGQHHAALAVIKDALTRDSPQAASVSGATLAARMVEAISLLELGAVADARTRFESLLADSASVDPSTRGSFLLEAGRAFYVDKDPAAAEDCWTEAARIFETIPEARSQYARALGNLGHLLLRSGDPKVRERGESWVERSLDIKASCGDLAGMATGYSMLGLHYWRSRRYERALAFLNRDLAISKRIGDQRGVATTLGNMAGLYVDLAQLGPARKTVAEIERIANDLHDEALLERCRSFRLRIEEIGREAGRTNRRIGPEAPCACGSGVAYRECCGLADHEPVSPPGVFTGLAEDSLKIRQELETAGKSFCILDYVLREAEGLEQRFAWTQFVPRDGWFEHYEVPDVANLQMTAARDLAKQSKADVQGTSFPLACLFSCVAALESFINTVCFFATHPRSLAALGETGLPAELLADPIGYQRATELGTKWDALGRALCGESWRKSVPWDEFKTLVSLRNEFVHFKVREYERVIPAPKKPPDLVARLPRTVQTRDIPHSFPFRVLTPSLAEWAVQLAAEMISGFRKSYSEARRPGPDVPTGQ